MKTTIAACSLILATGSVFAGSGPFGNPDLGGLQYPVTMSNPIPSGAPVTVSLDNIQRGNPDAYSGFIEGYTPYFAATGPTLTSLDVFMQGNPDLGYEVDLSLPVVGSAQAQGIAAQRCRKPADRIC